jgi:protein-disulfide isomerase
MPNCPICYDYPFEGERCPLCGFPASSISLLEHHSPEIKWRVFYRKPDSPEWHSWDVTRYELAKAMKARFERLGYETKPVMPIFKEHSSNPKQEEVLTPMRPMSWDYLGSFIDAEGSFITTTRLKDTARVLYTRIGITQKNREIRGYQLLQQIKSFIEKEIPDIKVGFWEDKKRGVVMVYLYGHIDCYRFAAEVLPYLKHEKRIREAIEILYTIEQWKRRRIEEWEKQLQTEIEPTRIRALRALIAREKRDLEKIQDIKAQKPYISTLTRLYIA